MAGLGVVKSKKVEATVESIKELFPKKRATITEETVAMINSANLDPEFNGNEFIESLVTYQDIMLKHSYSMKEYITAVKFCAYLEAEDDNFTQAYIRARSEDDFITSRRGFPVDSPEYKNISSAASRYRKSPLVKKILTACDMPLYLMFQGARYRAVGVLAREMETATYSKDRISAADKLLTHVKPPENIQVEMEIGMNEEAKDFGQQLTLEIAKSVAMQRKMLEAGLSLKDATKMGIQLNENEEIEDAVIENE